MVNKHFKVILFVAFFIVATNMYAPPPPPPPPTLPIDGGAIYLIISAVALGFKKLYNKNK